jgi:GxxExxY protein
MNLRRLGPPDEPPLHVDEYARAVIGAAIEVHRHLGPGFLESVYEQAMVVELGLRSIVYRRQAVMPVLYKDQLIAEHRLDLLVEDERVVELKAVESVLPVHTAQVMSYLKAGAFQLGLILNFRVREMRDGVRRIVWTD